MVPQQKNGNGIIKKAVAAGLIGLLLTVMAWGATTINADKDRRINENTARNIAQDTSIARINTEQVLDRQAFRAIDHNIQLVMDAMLIPEWRRAHLDSGVVAEKDSL